MHTVSYACIEKPEKESPTIIYHEHFGSASFVAKRTCFLELLSLHRYGYRLHPIFHSQIPSAISNGSEFLVGSSQASPRARVAADRTLTIPPGPLHKIPTVHTSAMSVAESVAQMLVELFSIFKSNSSREPP
jgi:hypothetical protein